MILVVAEQRDGKLNRATWEAIAAAQQAGEIRSRSPSWRCRSRRRGRRTRRRGRADEV